MKKLGHKTAELNLESINVKMKKTVLLLTLLLFSQAEAFNKRPSLADQNVEKLSQLQESCSFIQHRLSNQEVQSRTYENRLQNFEEMLDDLRDAFRQLGNQQEETLQTRSQTIDLRLKNLEQSNQALTSDLQQLTNHANETTTSLKNCKQKLSDLERNIANLQSAVNSVLEAFQIKAAPSNSVKTYKVKNGDNLEKIAKLHHTSIQAIKELNQMSNDKIIVGKTLKIP